MYIYKIFNYLMIREANYTRFDGNLYIGENTKLKEL